MAADPAAPTPDAERLAAELTERGISTETVLDAGLILVEQEPNPVAKLMGWIGKLGLGSFPGIGGFKA